MTLRPSEADNPFWDEFMANRPINRIRGGALTHT